MRLAMVVGSAFVLIALQVSHKFYTWSFDSLATRSNCFFELYNYDKYKYKQQLRAVTILPFIDLLYAITGYSH